MSDKTELVDKLSKDIENLESKIEHSFLYNVRNQFVMALLRCGFAIDYAFPFILAASIVGHIQVAKGNIPFRTDYVIDKANVYMIDDYNEQNNFTYNDEVLEYSTGWSINENGEYQRMVTSYRLSEEIGIDDINRVLSMSKEEIDNLLVILDTKIICKKELTAGDEIYSSGVVIVANYNKSEEEIMIRPETIRENFIQSALFVVLSLSLGFNFKNIKKMIIKNYVRDKLMEYELSFKEMDKKDLEVMKKILEMKKNNLAMIDGSISNEDVSRRRLRKV